MDVNELIKEGDRLKGLYYDEPDQDLWDNDVKEYIKPFGEATYQILESALFPSVIPYGRDGVQQQRGESIIKVQKLLESLKKRSIAKQAAQSEIINPNFEQARQRLHEKVTNNYNISAPTTFGDNSPISQITIGEFLAGLEKKIEEEVEDNIEKNRLLAGIKAITADPSFVAIASIAATSIMKKLLNG